MEIYWKLKKFVLSYSYVKEHAIGEKNSFLYVYKPEQKLFTFMKI